MTELFLFIAFQAPSRVLCHGSATHRFVEETGCAVFVLSPGTIPLPVTETVRRGAPPGAIAVRGGAEELLLTVGRLTALCGR